MKTSKMLAPVEATINSDWASVLASTPGAMIGVSTILNIVMINIVLDAATMMASSERSELVCAAALLAKKDFIF